MKAFATMISRAVAGLLIVLVRAYQLLLSPFLGQTCRYYPSCSAYAVQALQTHGPLKGTWLAGRRLLRCHPWSPGGVDHVPGVPGRDHSPTPDLLSATAGGTTQGENH